MALPSQHQLDRDQEDRETELIGRYIKPHPHKSGRAYAYFPDYGASVAAIVRDLAVDGDVARTAAAWRMPEDAVRAAVGYHRRNRAFIDARILLEDDQFGADSWWGV